MPDVLALVRLGQRLGFDGPAARTCSQSLACISLFGLFNSFCLFTSHLSHKDTLSADIIANSLGTGFLNIHSGYAGLTAQPY